VGSSAAGDYPDGIAYVPALKTLLVSDEHGGGDTVIDAVAMRPLGFVALGSDPGNSQFDAGAGTVLVAAHGGDLIEIDPASRSVKRRIKLEGCNTPHGLQIDPSGRHRAYVACAGNAKLLVVEIASGRVDARFDIASDPDVLALDPGLGRLYVAAESSRIDVFDVRAARVSKLGEGSGGPDSHTVAVDPSSHRVYLPLTDVGGHPMLRELAPAS
jgi:DNA-binding beta-propeller fold protein YncE